MAGLWKLSTIIGGELITIMPFVRLWLSDYISTQVRAFPVRGNLTNMKLLLLRELHTHTTTQRFSIYKFGVIYVMLCHYYAIFWNKCEFVWINFTLHHFIPQCENCSTSALTLIHYCILVFCCTGHSSVKLYNEYTYIFTSRLLIRHFVLQIILCSLLPTGSSFERFANRLNDFQIVKIGVSNE